MGLGGKPGELFSGERPLENWRIRPASFCGAGVAVKFQCPPPPYSDPPPPPLPGRDGGQQWGKKKLGDGFFRPGQSSEAVVYDGFK